MAIGLIQLTSDAERFDLIYIGSDIRKHRPVNHSMRASIWSMEFYSFLIEHFAGGFPVWVSPGQVCGISNFDGQ